MFELIKRKLNNIMLLFSFLLFWYFLYFTISKVFYVSIVFVEEDEGIGKGMAETQGPQLFNGFDSFLYPFHSGLRCSI